jgi:hypothetical protein
MFFRLIASRSTKSNCKTYCQPDKPRKFWIWESFTIKKLHPTFIVTLRVTNNTRSWRCTGMRSHTSCHHNCVCITLLVHSFIFLFIQGMSDWTVSVFSQPRWKVCKAPVMGWWVWFPLSTVVNCKESLNLNNEAQPVAAIPIGTQTCSALVPHFSNPVHNWKMAFCCA